MAQPFNLDDIAKAEKAEHYALDVERAKIAARQQLLHDKIFEMETAALQQHATPQDLAQMLTHENDQALENLEPGKLARLIERAQRVLKGKGVN